MPTDRLERALGVGDWLGKRRPSYGDLRRGAWPARQAIGRHIHFAVVSRANARIRLSLRINISLIIEKIYKMVEDFSTQFSSLNLPMKYLAIMSRHPEYVYTGCHESVCQSLLCR